jgi:predicted metal-dependent hydrolase
MTNTPVTNTAVVSVAVIRSRRSKKTVSARLRDGVLTITVPSWMSDRQADEWVAKMRTRYEKARRSSSTDLAARAQALSRSYGLPQQTSIVWTRELTSRWGSCTTDTGAIRINGKLQRAPVWVLDYVIVHELAHLVHADHSPAFWAVVRRYPKTERAIGFLMGMGLAESDSDTDSEADPGAEQNPEAIDLTIEP